MHLVDNVSLLISFFCIFLLILFFTSAAQINLNSNWRIDYKLFMVVEKLLNSFNFLGIKFYNFHAGGYFAFIN